MYTNLLFTIIFFIAFFIWCSKFRKVFPKGAKRRRSRRNNRVVREPITDPEPIIISEPVSVHLPTPHRPARPARPHTPAVISNSTDDPNNYPKCPDCRSKNEGSAIQVIFRMPDNRFRCDLCGTEF